MSQPYSRRLIGLRPIYVLLDGKRRPTFTVAFGPRAHSNVQGSGKQKPRVFLSPSFKQVYVKALHIEGQTLANGKAVLPRQLFCSFGTGSRASL